VAFDAYHMHGCGPMARALYRLYEVTRDAKYKVAADRYALFLINALHDPPVPFANTIEINGVRRTSLSSAWMYGKALAPCYEEFCKHNPKEDFLERKALALYRWLQQLGLIFLRYADHRFTQAEKELAGKGTGRRGIGKEDYQAKGVMFLPPKARFRYLLDLPEGENIGKAINEAIKAVESENEELKGVLPTSYTKIDNSTLVALLKNMSSIPVDAEGDTFGKIYEYFLGNFARAEGQKGGEFFTPTSLVKLIVQIIEPYHGRIFDPACGSGGMFVQSADFVQAHKHNPHEEIAVYGQERVDETRQLCLMNLAVHALSGDIRQGNSYYDDLHESVGKFDFVMANPPINVDKVDKERIKDDPRYPLGMPKADNANYLWIELFYSSLSANGRAGFVMANSAADARQSEMEIRKKLLLAPAVDVMVAIGPNFFYTVTLPCTLWFLDRGKAKSDRTDKVLFIDARQILRQADYFTLADHSGACGELRLHIKS
jgi:type I restriction enzyme M protein